MDVYEFIESPSKNDKAKIVRSVLKHNPQNELSQYKAFMKVQCSRLSELFVFLKPDQIRAKANSLWEKRCLEKKMKQGHKITTAKQTCWKNYAKTKAETVFDNERLRKRDSPSVVSNAKNIRPQNTRGKRVSWAEHFEEFEITPNVTPSSTTSSSSGSLTDKKTAQVVETHDTVHKENLVPSSNAQQAKRKLSWNFDEDTATKYKKRGETKCAAASQKKITQYLHNQASCDKENRQKISVGSKTILQKTDTKKASILHDISNKCNANDDGKSATSDISHDLGQPSSSSPDLFPDLFSSPKKAVKVRKPSRILRSTKKPKTKVLASLDKADKGKNKSAKKDHNASLNKAKEDKNIPIPKQKVPGTKTSTANVNDKKNKLSRSKKTEQIPANKKWETRPQEKTCNTSINNPDSIASPVISLPVSNNVNQDTCNAEDLISQINETQIEHSWYNRAPKRLEVKMSDVSFPSDSSNSSDKVANEDVDSSIITTNNVSPIPFQNTCLIDDNSTKAFSPNALMNAFSKGNNWLDTNQPSPVQSDGSNSSDNLQSSRGIDKPTTKKTCNDSSSFVEDVINSLRKLGENIHPPVSLDIDEDLLISDEGHSSSASPELQTGMAASSPSCSNVYFANVDFLTIEENSSAKENIFSPDQLQYHSKKVSSSPGNDASFSSLQVNQPTQMQKQKDIAISDLVLFGDVLQEPMEMADQAECTARISRKKKGGKQQANSWKDIASDFELNFEPPLPSTSTVETRKMYSRTKKCCAKVASTTTTEQENELQSIKKLSNEPQANDLNQEVSSNSSLMFDDPIPMDFPSNAVPHKPTKLSKQISSNKTSESATTKVSSSRQQTKLYQDDLNEFNGRKERDFNRSPLIGDQTDETASMSSVSPLQGATVADVRYCLFESPVASLKELRKDPSNFVDEVKTKKSSRRKKK